MSLINLKWYVHCVSEDGSSPKIKLWDFSFIENYFLKKGGRKESETLYKKLNLDDLTMLLDILDN